MKNNFKSLLQDRSKRNNDTLVYVLLLLFVVILVSTAVYFIWLRLPQEIVYNYKEELGEKKTSPTADDVSKLISGNRNRLKTVQRVLANKIKGRRLTDKEKEEVKAELNNIGFDLDKLLQSFDLKVMEKESPELLSSFYSQLYEQGKVSVRLKSKTSVDRPYEEVKRQKEFQEVWEISDYEERDIESKMNFWITEWYKQAKEDILPRYGKILAEVIIPVKIEGRKANPNSQNDIEYFKDINNEIRNGVRKQGWEELVDLLNRPLRIDFLGYGGFISQQDAEKSTEGKETFGLTHSDLPIKEPTGWNIGKSDETSLRYIDENRRKIMITLKKELFFNRLGYEEWITSFRKKNNERNCFDICFEEVVETIAHELAHAIVSSMEVDYKGEEGGGHGGLFYDIMEDIEKMIKKSPEFSKFENWWKMPEKNGEN
jgi:hypothetical protein